MLDMYLWFEGPQGCNNIKGEAQDADIRAKENGALPIKIKNFGFEIANAPTIGSASGGASSGRCVLNPFTIQKTTDSCSPDFFGACAKGGHFDKATIFLRKDNKPYIRYVFNMCFVSKVNWSGSESDEAPSESIEFAYGALRIFYYPQTKKGELVAPKQAVWNQVNNNETDTVAEYGAAGDGSGR